AAARLALERYKQGLDGSLQQEQAEFGSFSSCHLAMVGPGGEWCVQGGRLRLVDGEGTIQADQLEAADYDQLLGEALEPWSCLSFPYVRALGYPAGLYRVGPLARLNVCDCIDSPWAARELAEYRQRNGRIVNSSFAYHQARLVEIVACLEALESLLEDPLLLDPHVRYRASLNRREAVGMGEAPRGTLFHHYRVDTDGLLEHVNLLVATGQNNLAMNRTITGLAQRFLDDRGDEPIPEGLLNRIEAGIRCFDPCLSCATHAAGQMALQVQLFDHQGTLLAERSRP
ncbi:MAG: nickel-dependent hydrogenase large subunit, partial [Cyanobacteriota bacterium]